MTKQQILDDAMKLSPAERREVADALWASVDDPRMISPQLQAELERRLADSKANPGSGVPLDEFRRRLHAQAGLPAEDRDGR